MVVFIIKIVNDLCWMNFGLLVGLGEIELEVLQFGFFIMFGKVNLVILEVAAMVGVQVIGNDVVIIVVGQFGNFELNVMLLLVVYNLFFLIEILVNVSVLLVDKVIVSFNVNEVKLVDVLICNLILVIVFNLIIGYEKVVKIVKQVYVEGWLIIDVVEENIDIGCDELI